MTMPCRALIFDLDGVLADSAVLHFAAWQRLARELDIPFDAHANEALKGVDRAGSLRLLLAMAGRDCDAATFDALAARKNAYYLELLDSVGAGHLLPGAGRLVTAGRAAGLKLAVASASRNAVALLDRLGIGAAFDFVADPAVARPKPAPDLFLACAKALDVDPGDCIGLEDAAVGVAAIIAAGMVAVGIGEAAAFPGAAIVFPTTADVDLDQVLRLPSSGVA